MSFAQVSLFLEMMINMLKEKEFLKNNFTLHNSREMYKRQKPTQSV
jgi:hypothetical protein